MKLSHTKPSTIVPPSLPETLEEEVCNNKKIENYLLFLSVHKTCETFSAFLRLFSLSPRQRGVIGSLQHLLTQAQAKRISAGIGQRIVAHRFLRLSYTSLVLRGQRVR